MPKNPHDCTNAMHELNDKLKSCDPEIQNYVAALRRRNLELQTKIANLQVEITSRLNQIQVMSQTMLLDFDLELSDDQRADKIAEIMARASPPPLTDNNLSDKPSSNPSG